MYMEQWRRPGCIVWAAFVFIAFNVSSVALVLPRPWGWLALPLFLLMMWLQVKAMKRLTLRRVPLCPHCGVTTEPTFRICRNCGRVKVANLSR